MKIAAAMANAAARPRKGVPFGHTGRRINRTVNADRMSIAPFTKSDSCKIGVAVKLNIQCQYHSIATVAKNKRAAAP